MIREAIIKLSKKEDLTGEEAYECMNEIMNGQCSEVQISSYLTALSMKGETIEEITGSAKGMREHATKLLNDEDVLEIVGTGGDGSNSFNISTTSSIIIAASGIKVAKHGNRAASSASGAADCLEALGVNIMLDAPRCKEILNKINICFLFAQTFHKAMKYVGPTRKELGIRTIFNILGPLTNPAGASLQVMGVYDESLVEPLARVLSNLGVKRAMVVYGQDRLDEISLAANTTVCEVIDGNFKTYEISPEQFGFEKCQKEDLVGGTPKENAQITLDILNGVKGHKRNAVLLNAGAGIYIGGKADSLQDGIEIAKEMIDSGKAKAKLDEFIKETNL
jgi:anthranilate phosphoribosyltransferase